MIEAMNDPLCEAEVDGIVAKANGYESQEEKVNCVIREVKTVSSADNQYQRSCVIYILNNQLGIGPYQNVVEQITNAFPGS